MNILLVGRNAQVGGGSTFRLNIGRGLLARGHRVSVAALGGPMVSRYREAGLGYYWAPAVSICRPLLERAARESGADLIHASNTSAGDVALAVARKLGLPLIVSLHNTIADHEARHECLKEARRIIVFDSGAAASAAQFTQEFDPAKIIVASRPVERRALNEAAVSPLRVAYVGRLSSRKGRVALDLIEAFERFLAGAPAASLTIIGDGSLLAEVRARARNASEATGATVEAVGRLLDPGPALRSAGVVVGAGYAALEAVMQGRAVLGAGFNGYGVVDAENALDAVQSNFGDTIKRWEMTPDNFHIALCALRDAWEEPAHRDRFWRLDRVVAPLHSIEAVAERLEGIYQEALAAPPPVRVGAGVRDVAT